MPSALNKPPNKDDHIAKMGVTGVRHFFNAFKFSLQGLRAALQHEAAFRQELALCLVMGPAAFWVAGNPIDTAMLIFPLLIVLVTELLNSAVEAAIDRFGNGYNELSGRAKDLGSAAVMVSMIAVASVWLLIIYANWPRLASDISTLF